MAVFRSDNVANGLGNSYDLTDYHSFHGDYEFMVAHASKEHIDAGNHAAHAVIGDVAPPPGATAEQVQDCKDGRLYTFGTPPVSLTYGEVLALAGDYYARFDELDDSYTGTNQASRCLMQPLTSADDLGQALKLAHRHQNAKSEAAENEARQKKVECLIRDAAETKFLQCASSDWREAQKALREIKSWEKRYYLLTLQNWDHFHPYCFRRYRRLHERATRHAYTIGEDERRRTSSASPDRPSSELVRLLMTPLAMNAFADHFLMDSLSSGHLFTSRKGIMSDGERRSEIPDGIPWYFTPWEQDINVNPDSEIDVEFRDESGALIETVTVTVGDIAASLWAGKEHDRLSKNGVRVSSRSCPDKGLRGKTFVAKGDWMLDYLNEMSDETLEKTIAFHDGRYDALFVRRSLNESISEVLEAFQRGLKGMDFRLEWRGLAWTYHAAKPTETVCATCAVDWSPEPHRESSPGETALA